MALPPLSSLKVQQSLFDLLPKRISAQSAFPRHHTVARHNNRVGVPVHRLPHRLGRHLGRNSFRHLSVGHRLSVAYLAHHTPHLPLKLRPFWRYLGPPSRSLPFAIIIHPAPDAIPFFPFATKRNLSPWRGIDKRFLPLFAHSWVATTLNVTNVSSPLLLMLWRCPFGQ